jgi:hypothetical protein
MKPKDIPDYTKCRQLFEAYLKSQGKLRNGKLEFSPNKKSKAKKVANNEESGDEDEVDGVVAKKRKPNLVAKAKRGRKPKAKEDTPELENCENEEPDKSLEEKIPARGRAKRKSTEPAVVVNVKKTKLTPKATPPTKKNHANIATQTSLDKRKRSPRQVSFDSPICEIIGEKKPLKLSKDSSVNSSGDIFDDSFTFEEKKIKPKKRLLSNEEVIVKRIVKKKVTTVKPKGKSWKDSAAIINGRSPPK